MPLTRDNGENTIMKLIIFTEVICFGIIKGTKTYFLQYFSCFREKKKYHQV